MDADERSARVAGVFDRAADTYDQVGVAWFGPIAGGLVREAAPRPGERVLDIGVGRGAALFPLADAVGPTGRVTGIDLAPRMIEATAAAVAQRGLTNVELRVMDAGAPQLPAASYDLLVASLVVFFLPDPAAALRAWLSLLVPGGRLALATFGDAAPEWRKLDSVFAPYLPPAMLDARTSGAAGPFSSDAGVEELVTSAGYAAVRTTGFELTAAFASADQWYDWTWSHGQRGMWERVPAADLARVRATAGAQLESLRGADGQIRLTQHIRYTLAERPGT